MTTARDEELARQAAAGDRAAFAALVEDQYDRVYRMAWRWSGGRETAEDIAQEVMVKLATAIRSFRGESKVSTWIYRITYATAIDALRARQRIVTLAPPDMMALTDGAIATTPEDDYLGRELWEAVRTLPEQQRDAVLLVYGEDLSHAEAARIMDCTEKTVSWHLFEARKRLRIKLEAVG